MTKRYILLSLSLAALAFGQMEVKDIDGDTVLTITSNISQSSAISQLFYISKIQPASIIDNFTGPVFRASVKAKKDLVGVSLVASLHKKDGTVITFKPKRLSVANDLIHNQLNDFSATAVMQRDHTYEIAYVFPESEPLIMSDLDWLTITLENPERVARLTEEHERKVAEQTAKEIAAEEAQAKARQAKVRMIVNNCRIIYRNTVDERIRDLTVRQEQQVKACQALGLYPPR